MWQGFSSGVTAGVASVSKDQLLPHIRVEPAPAAPEGACCWPEPSHEQQWLGVWESRDKKGKKLLATSSWERGPGNRPVDTGQCSEEGRG